MTRNRRVIALVAAAGLAAVTAACSPAGRTPAAAHRPTTSTTAPVASTSTTPGAPMQVHVYFLADGHLTTSRRSIAATDAVADAALRQLLDGPSQTEQGNGLTTAIPAGSTLLGVSLQGGVATVNLSSSFAAGGTSQSQAARLAQVTYTVTQFAEVSGVRFQLDGRAVTSFGDSGLSVPNPAARTSFEALAPAILVESPDAGDAVMSPIEVTGSANVYEATFQLELLDASGQSIAAITVHASAGTGTRGSFSTALRYGITADQDGALVAYDLSPKDGSRQDVIRIPLHLGAA